MDLVDKLKSGRNVYGTAFSSIGPSWPKQVQAAGLDFVFIDTEHIALDRSDLSRLCQVFTALNVPPIVRIASHDPNLASQALGAGAIGVVAPYLETVAQIQSLVGAVKFGPLKGELLENVISGKQTLSQEMTDYLHKHNGRRLAIANIESVPALERLDSLLSVAGLDAVFIGPHDLSCSLGIPEQYDNEKFIVATRTIVQTARAKGLAVGIHFSLEPERQA
jgi:4-hydroxy-2-oxoheptanedioate aldolase